MDTSTLDMLGITQEEFQNRVIDKIAQNALSCISFDYESNGEYRDNTKLRTELDKKIKDSVSQKLEDINDKIIYPLISEKVNNLVIECTNLYGEKKGESKTFIEYLTNKADNFLIERVDSSGRTKDECARANISFYESKGSTRLSAAIDKSLESHFKECIDAIVKDSKAKLEASLSELLKAALATAKTTVKLQ